MIPLDYVGEKRYFYNEYDAINANSISKVIFSKPF